MIKSRLYLYDSTKDNFKGEDYSRYILLGDTTKDDLTEVKGTVELTLAGLPSRITEDNKSEEFAPSTLFVYERADVNEFGEASLETWHMCVQSDTVSQPVLSDNNYFDHHITLVEASAISQNYLVDNIAVTYRLQDITLEGDLNIDTNAKAITNENEALGGVVGKQLGKYNVWEVDTDKNPHVTLGKKLDWEFANWFSTGNPCRGEKEEWTTFPAYLPVPLGQESTQVNLPVPMLKISNGTKNAWGDNQFTAMGYCTVRTVVTEIEGNNQTVIKDFVTNPYGANDNNSHEKWTKDWAFEGTSFEAQTGEIVNGTNFAYTPTPISIVGYWTVVPTKLKIANYDNSPDPQTRRIIFEAKPNRTYIIKTFLNTDFNYEFNEEADAVAFPWSSPSIRYTSTNNGYPCATISFTTYYQGDNAKVQITSAPEQNAYALFQRAQLTTQDINKVSGVAINDTPMTFLVSDEDKLKLTNTKIVENFFNQKNFWELLIEIGKYIHSIPKIVFDTDNRFRVEWQPLGTTEIFEDQATKVSIFNSRDIENYISACSSYITNMVQLNGEIDEWIAPKSSSEDYLVYNSVAEIHTSKPIIEIISMEAKCITSGKYQNNSGQDIATANDGIANLIPENKFTYAVDSSVTGTTSGIYYIKQGNNYIPVSLPEDYVSGTTYYTRTIINGYIFEESVYNLLDITATSLVNKGLAIYYELGTNVIKGLNYRLPSINSGDYETDFAIKRILRQIFDIRRADFDNVMINDFIFHIVYRTKDTVRSDQTRPDLRKYLLASNYDKIPQHNQFNNQTDVVVDSVKFGNNIYGKLIRTGNTEYTKTEWVSALSDTKHVGELYNINGERYYVATVSNTNYGTYIQSDITFSKDYNQLSEIIGIPSEPRFYEISERNIIDREKSFNDYIVLGTSPQTQTGSSKSFIQNEGWYHIYGLLFTNAFNQFPKYAITVFKNDFDRKYGEVKSNEFFYKEVCHPISAYSMQNTLTLEWDMADNFSAGDSVSDNVTVPSGGVDAAYRTLQPTQYTDAYGRSDLVDFYILSDLRFRNYELTSDDVLNFPNSPLRTKFPYCETYVGKMTFSGSISKADLTQFVFDTLGRSPEEGDGIACVVTTTVDGVTTTTYKFCSFIGIYNFYSDWYIHPTNEYLINQIDNGEIDWNKPGLNYTNESAYLYLFGNESIWNYSDNIPDTMGDNDHGLALMKDARETIHFNYNLQMITDSDRFVLSSWLWQPQKGTLKLALLNKEINKISNDTIPNDDIISDDYTPNPGFLGNDLASATITIPISETLNGVDLTDVKAIAIVSDNIVANDTTSGARYFVMGRNITGLDTSDITGILTPEQAKEKAKADWYISNYDKSMFPHQ